MLATQYTLKPSEEEFDLPAITMDKLDGFCRLVRAVCGNEYCLLGRSFPVFLGV